MVKETNDHEATRHKKYYNQKFKRMKIVLGDLVLVWVKAFGPDHKIADHWDQVLCKVLFQQKDSPVYKVQPINDSSDENINTLQGICCFHFNHFMKMKLKLRSKM